MRGALAATSPRARHLEAIAALALALGAGACGGSTPQVADAPPPSFGPPPRLVLPRRPHQVEDVAVDYPSLPRMTPLPLAPNAKGPSFKRRSDGLYDLEMPDDLYAEIQVGSMIFFSVPSESHTAVVGAPKTTRPPQANGGELATPSAAGAALCGKKQPPTRAVWIGFSPKTKTPGSMEFVRYEGMFDPATCSARPTAAWHVQAPAILEGALYAFRGGAPDPLAKPTEAAAEIDTPLDVEKLEVIGPKSIWVGSTAPTAEQKVPLDQPFARLVVPIHRGTTATAMLDVSGDDLKAFRGIDAADLADAKVVSFSFDVVWGSAERWPTAVASMAALPGLPEQLVPAPTGATSYEFEVNLDE